MKDYLADARSARDAAIEEIERRAENYPILIQALRQIQSQCAGHADEFSRNVYKIADHALQRVSK